MPRRSSLLKVLPRTLFLRHLPVSRRLRGLLCPRFGGILARRFLCTQGLHLLQCRLHPQRMLLGTAVSHTQKYKSARDPSEVDGRWRGWCADWRFAAVAERQVCFKSVPCNLTPCVVVVSFNNF